MCIFILSKKLKFYTKEILKLFNITLVAFGFIIAIILIKYKPTYKVTISGKQVGYVQSKQALEESIKTDILEDDAQYVDFVTLASTPEYELKLVERSQETNENEIMEILVDSSIKTYKYYQVALNDNAVASLENLEEAEEVVNKIKEEYDGEDLELNLQVKEKYTENVEEISTESVDVAKVNLEEKVEEVKEEEEERKRIEAMPEVNGIKLAVLPVSGRITSRFGSISSIRTSAHKGLDIACSSGTPIKAVADGTVIFAKYNGSFGNLVKIDHGNNVQTWYAHCSKIYAKVGQEVTAGDVISAVGSTGNSTGPHLHLEIRINGSPVNPQKYLYN